MTELEETTYNYQELLLNDYNQLKINKVYDFNNNPSLVDAIHDQLLNNRYDYFYQIFICCLDTNKYMNKRRELLTILYIVNNLELLIEEKEENMDNLINNIAVCFRRHRNYYKDMIKIILQYIIESPNMDTVLDKMHFVTMTDIFVNNFNAIFSKKDRKYFIGILNSFDTNYLGSRDYLKNYCEGESNVIKENKRFEDNINQFIRKLIDKNIYSIEN